MPTPDRPITVATTAMRAVHDKKANVQRMLELLDEATDQGAELVVFPEQCLQGYMFGVAHQLTRDEFDYHHSNAEQVPGPSCEILAEEAGRRGVLVAFGMTEAVDVGVIFNTVVLLGGDGVIGAYRKVHGPGDELHIYRHGSRYPVFDTHLGRLGVMTCYDAAFPEVARSLALGGAQLLLMPTAWPRFSNYEEAPEDLEVAPLGHVYDAFCRARAAENQRWYVSANQVGRDEISVLDYYGHSGIVDPTGSWVTQLGYEEGVAVSEIDVEGGIADAATGWFDVVKDRRPETYGAVVDKGLYEPDVKTGRLPTE